MQKIMIINYIEAYFNMAIFFFQCSIVILL
jgi:hypothetical protein